MNIKKIFLLCLFGIFCLIPVVGAADKDITVKSVSAVDASKEVSLNSIDDVDVEFNDLGQYAEYEVVLKNNSDKDLFLNDLVTSGSSEEFISYSISDEYLGTEIEANSSKKVNFLIKTEEVDKAGRNLTDDIKLKFSFGETIKVINPETNNNVIEIILSIILICIALFIIFSKTNKKIKLSVLIISLMVLGTTSVLADDEITVKVSGKVSYISQVLMENTGTTLVSNQVNYESSKDVWAYYDQVKNIYIKSLSKAPSKYAYKFDLTTSDKNKVVGYLVENGETNVPFDLYIIGRGMIYANEDSTGLFSFPNVEKIEGLDNVIFDNTTIYKGMFAASQKLSSVDLSTIDLSNATDVSYMFYKADKVNVDKANLNLENVTVQNNMFTTYLYDEVKKDAVSDADVDFSNVVTSGKYIVNSTLSNNNPIYYYRGNVTNNNVKFAGKCWKIVRTTDTGGVKLVYNGVANSSGYCSGDNSYVKTSVFNLWNQYGQGPAVAGYMYGDDSYMSKNIDLGRQSETYVYGNDIEWDKTNQKYVLKDTMTSSSWSSDRDKIVKKYRYTCFNSTGECSSVSYIIYVGDYEGNYLYDNNDVHYLTFTSGDNLEKVKEKMFTNTSSSEAKKVVDNWYKNNMISYKGFLEDTVWCNDRSITSGPLKSNTEVVSLKDKSYFGGENRIESSQPSVVCPNKNDSFTVDEANGNGALDYPVGLLTADELVMSGYVSHDANLSDSYLHNVNNMWSMTPTYYDYRQNGYHISIGVLYDGNVDTNHYIRPAISLNANADYVSGDGTVTNPYVINDQNLIYSGQ